MLRFSYQKLRKLSAAFSLWKVDQIVDLNGHNPQGSLNHGAVIMHLPNTVFTQYLLPQHHSGHSALWSMSVGMGECW